MAIHTFSFPVQYSYLDYGLLWLPRLLLNHIAYSLGTTAMTFAYQRTSPDSNLNSGSLIFYIKCGDIGCGRQDTSSICSQYP